MRFNDWQFIYHNHLALTLNLTMMIFLFFSFWFLLRSFLSCFSYSMFVKIKLVGQDEISFCSLQRTLTFLAWRTKVLTRSLTLLIISKKLIFSASVLRKVEEETKNDKDKEKSPNLKESFSRERRKLFCKNFMTHLRFFGVCNVIKIDRCFASLVPTSHSLHRDDIMLLWIFWRRNSWVICQWNKNKMLHEVA